MTGMSDTIVRAQHFQSMKIYTTTAFAPPRRYSQVLVVLRRFAGCLVAPDHAFGTEAYLIWKKDGWAGML